MKALIILLLAAATAAKLAPLYSQPNRIPGRYIVKLKGGQNVDSILAELGNPRVRQRYSSIFPGFAAELTDHMVDILRKSNVVEYIEEDGVYHADSVASWGLDRIDQISLPLDGNFVSPMGTGNGVDVYILDTGINYGHVDFGGRAFFGFDPISGNGIDCNGHGSHCSGTTVGTTYGIAKTAHVYGVRILNCVGSGSTSDIVAGCEWVGNNHTGPSVASMSLGGSGSTTLDDGVRYMINRGVTVSVSAGNDDASACGKSPARTAEAITVGATDDTDTRASFSNYGPCVDIFGPGVAITSAWIGSENATNTISGTSMSCPHVAGAAAVLLGNDSRLTPNLVKETLQIKSIAGAVLDPMGGSPNLLLYIGPGSGGGFIPPPFDDGCGGYFNATAGNVSSPMWPYEYDNNYDCDYLINRDGFGFIYLLFNVFDLEPNGLCSWDSLSIYDGKNASAPFLGEYCGLAGPGNVTSTGSNLFLRFHSDGSVTRPGFHASYYFAESGGCGYTFTMEFGVMTSPNYPEKYNDNENCEITIRGQAGKIVTITFSHFDIEQHTDCTYDAVQIFDGSDATGTRVANLCGPDIPPPVYSSVGSGLYLLFTSDASVSRTGFKATYTVQ